MHRIWGIAGWLVIASCLLDASGSYAGEEGVASVLRYLANRAERLDSMRERLIESAFENVQQRRSLVREVTEEFGLPPREPMKGAVVHVKDEGDLAVEEVIFHWAGTTYAAGHVIRLKQPAQPGARMPALVVCPDDLAHYTWLGYREFVDRAARAGVAVLFIEDPRIGRRHSADAGLFAVAAAAGMPIAAIRTFDALRGLDYLLTKPDIDPGRIGAIGFGAGVQHARLAAALDSRFQSHAEFPAVVAKDSAAQVSQIHTWISEKILPKPASSAAPLSCGKPEKPDFKVMTYLRGRIAKQRQVLAKSLESPDLWNASGKGIARWLEEACGTRTMKPAAAKVIAKTTAEGYVVETVRLGVDVGLECPAILVSRPATGTGRSPGVVLSHDGRLAAEAPEVQGTARELADQGYWVLVPDHVSVHAKSRQKLELVDVPAFFATADRAGLSPLAIRAAENVAAFQYLSGRSEVDPARIVIGGSGIGAIDACLAAVLDGRVAGVAAVNVTTFGDWAENVAPEETTFVHPLPYLPGMFAKMDLDFGFAVLAPRPLVVARLKEGWPKSGFAQVAATTAAAYRFTGTPGALVALGLRDPIDERMARLPDGAARQTAAVAKTILPAPPVPGVAGIKDALRSRDGVDSATGLVWVFSAVGGEEQEFCDGGYRLDTWSYFNDNGPAQRGLAMTPLVFKREANAYRLTGIGKTRVNAGSGLQTFPFEVVQGSDQVGAGYFFGFYTGDTAGKPNAGVVEYNDDYQDRMIILTLDGAMDHQKVALGQVYRENSRWPRAYSIQAVSKPK